MFVIYKNVSVQIFPISHTNKIFPFIELYRITEFQFPNYKRISSKQSILWARK